jgi:hypothetical protein
LRLVLQFCKTSGQPWELDYKNSTDYVGLFIGLPLRHKSSWPPEPIRRIYYLLDQTLYVRIEPDYRRLKPALTFNKQDPEAA